MEPEYLVYCGERGWWGSSGTYVSDVKDAKHFNRDGAVRFCATRFNRQATHEVPAVPVLLDDVQAIIR